MVHCVHIIRDKVMGTSEPAICVNNREHKAHICGDEYAMQTNQQQAMLPLGTSAYQQSCSELHAILIKFRSSQTHIHHYSLFITKFTHYPACSSTCAVQPVH